MLLYQFLPYLFHRVYHLVFLVHLLDDGGDLISTLSDLLTFIHQLAEEILIGPGLLHQLVDDAEAQPVLPGHVSQHLLFDDDGIDNINLL